MGRMNRRQAARVPCELPIRLQCQDLQTIDATLVDASRTGMRLRVEGAVLAVHRLSSLVQVARRVGDVFGEEFVGDVDHERLGPLIRRSLRPIRIAKRDWERADVELGCLLDHPLTDVEVGLMGIELPPVEVPDARGRQRTGGSRFGASAAGYDAYIYARDGNPGRALITRTASLSRGMAVLDLDPANAGAFEGLDVTALVIALAETFGSAVMLRIADSEEDVWVGPAEIKEVDVPPDGPGTVRLGVAFGRELRTEELNRLGLPTPA